MRPQTNADIVAECRKWFHTSCLDRESLCYDRTPESIAKIVTSGLELVADLPSPTSPVELKLDSEKGEQDRQEGSDGGRIQVASEAIVAQAIRDAAEESIIRGSVSTGIVGNGQKVIRARDIVARSTSGNDVQAASEDWIRDFGEDGFKDLVKRDEEGGDGFGGKTWKCRSCGCFM
jgi:hypothetical protein